MASFRSGILGAALCVAFCGIAWPQRGPLELTSRLGRQLYSQPDDAAIGAARQQLAAHPNDPKLALVLSLAEANRRQYREAVDTDTRGLRVSPDNVALLIERGHRRVGLRQFAAAQRDLERATTLDPKQLQGWYHLGLAHYFQGQFAAAAAGFRRARNLATNNDDLIDCSNWLYVSLQRAGEAKAAAAVLARIPPGMTNHEPHIAFYLRLIRFYQGALPEAKLRPAKPSDSNDTEAELSYDTVTYGDGNWHLYHHDAARARELFQSVVSGEAWNAWGFVGSEIDLARMKR